MSHWERERVARASHILMRLLKMFLGPFFQWRYRLAGENLEILYRIKPSYVILANHITTWDPFFIGYYVPAPVYNVTSDYQFRRRIMRVLHRLVGSIPKSKVIPDIDTIKRILEVRKNRGIIGIFPEGRRTWDGHTADTIRQTAKLLKVLKTPVIAGVLKGAYLSLPRWTKNPRRGRVTVSFHKLFSGPELRKLTLDEIQERIDNALHHDEYEFQERQMLPYRGSRPAENVELALFVCPECRTIGGLRSCGHRLRCERCGYAVWYNDYGFFERREGRLHFATVREWNVWQQEYLDKEITRRLEGFTGAPPAASLSSGGNGYEPIIKDIGLKMYVGYRRKPVRRHDSGDILLYPDSLLFRSGNGTSMRFPLQEIDGVNVQLGERLEFYHQKILYRFVSADRSVSGFKWLSAVRILKRRMGINGLERTQ